MAMSKVVKSIKPISKLKDYYYKGWHDIFIEKENVNVHFGNGEVEIIDLANAMRPDYECCTFTFSEIEFDSFGDMPFSKFISACQAGEYNCAKGSKNGAEIFSPFKRAVEQNLFIGEPGSRVFAKAILAGQVEAIIRKGKRRGSENLLEIACDCWQSEPGFWCYSTGGNGKNLRIGWYDWAVYDVVLK